MMVILYARVSTGKQAEKELSLSAQVRLMKRHAENQGWTLGGMYQDVHTGTSLAGRPGLLAALNHARRDALVKGLLVHKLDRLSRNTFNYLILKGKLKASGTKILSVVETIEDNPMGEFMEHIMAAQAEFYSANLSVEVKKGLEERLLRGRWNGAPPVGYLLKDGRVVLDPARSRFIRRAFERWATGTVSARELAIELHQHGLVGVTGKKISASALCRLLHNPFYKGLMMVNGKAYRGTYQPLISVKLFDRGQEIFRQKNGNGRTRQHLTFLLARKIMCPQCTSLLTGEHHLKKSGKIFRYYRCHEQGCSFSIRADHMDDEVRRQLQEMDLPEKLLPVLKKQLREIERSAGASSAERSTQLRKERRALNHELIQVNWRYNKGELDEETYDTEREGLHDSIRVVEWLLVNPGEEVSERSAERKLYDRLQNLENILASADVVAQREVIEMLLERIQFFGSTLRFQFTSLIEQLLGKSTMTYCEYLPQHLYKPKMSLAGATDNSSLTERLAAESSNKPTLTLGFSTPIA